MDHTDLFESPHRRLNLLTGDWVLVSPHRARRPWQGQVERPAAVRRPAYDPDCYLCPGNLRAGGVRNPVYADVFAFDNDFPALLLETPARSFNRDGLLIAEAEQGMCRVLCFSPRHDLTLSRMDTASVRLVVDAWVDQCRDLSAVPGVRYVQIFENRGELMGCSNPHPHCQVWASARLPNEPGREQAAQAAFSDQREECLLCSYLALELALGDRIVASNRGFVALTPFWAVWPFEVLVLPRTHVGSMEALESSQRDDLADVFCRLTAGYDRLFAAPFPYSMGFHQQPADGRAHPEWHLHAHFYPPLLRSASVRKFMVGYEMLATPQRDITVESAASRLRELIQAIPEGSTSAGIDGSGQSD